MFFLLLFEQHRNGLSQFPNNLPMLSRERTQLYPKLVVKPGLPQNTNAFFEKKAIGYPRVIVPNILCFVEVHIKGPDVQDFSLLIANSDVITYAKRFLPQNNHPAKKGEQDFANGEGQTGSQQTHKKGKIAQGYAGVVQKHKRPNGVNRPAVYFGVKNPFLRTLKPVENPADGQPQQQAGAQPDAQHQGNIVDNFSNQIGQLQQFTKLHKQESLQHQQKPQSQHYRKTKEEHHALFKTLTHSCCILDARRFSTMLKKQSTSTRLIL